MNPFFFFPAFLGQLFLSFVSFFEMFEQTEVSLSNDFAQNRTVTLKLTGQFSHLP